VSDPLCTSCRKPRPKKANGRHDGALGYCRACYRRHERAGRPASGPPSPVPNSDRVAARNRALRAARLEDYADLRSWGVSIADAAARVGVSRATAERYERELQEGALTDVAA